MKQAEYLRDELQRLRRIASDEDLKTLVYLLEVAEREAHAVLRLRRHLELASQKRQVGQGLKPDVLEPDVKEG